MSLAAAAIGESPLAENPDETSFPRQVAWFAVFLQPNSPHRMAIETPAFASPAPGSLPTQVIEDPTSSPATLSPESTLPNEAPLPEIPPKSPQNSPKKSLKKSTRKSPKKAKKKEAKQPVAAEESKEEPKQGIEPTHAQKSGKRVRADSINHIRERTAARGKPLILNGRVANCRVFGKCLRSGSIRSLDAEHRIRARPDRRYVSRCTVLPLLNSPNYFLNTHHRH